MTSLKHTIRSGLFDKEDVHCLAEKIHRMVYYDTEWRFGYVWNRLPRVCSQIGNRATYGDLGLKPLDMPYDVPGNNPDIVDHLAYVYPKYYTEYSAFCKVFETYQNGEETGLSEETLREVFWTIFEFTLSKERVLDVIDERNFGSDYKDLFLPGYPYLMHKESGEEVPVRIVDYMCESIRFQKYSLVIKAFKYTPRDDEPIPQGLEDEFYTVLRALRIAFESKDPKRVIISTIESLHKGSKKPKPVENAYKFLARAQLR